MTHVKSLAEDGRTGAALWHVTFFFSFSLSHWFRAVASIATQSDDEPVETPPDVIFLPFKLQFSQ
jgi:hypothetical protein